MADTRFVTDGQTDGPTDGNRANIEGLGAILDMIMMYFEVYSV